MALHTSPCKARRSGTRLHGDGRAWSLERGLGTYDAEEGGVEGDVAEAAQLGGLADDGAGGRGADEMGWGEEVWAFRREGRDRDRLGIVLAGGGSSLPFRACVVSIFFVSGPDWVRLGLVDLLCQMGCSSRTHLFINNSARWDHWYVWSSRKAHGRSGLASGTLASVAF
jgi:hypothetical protein